MSCQSDFARMLDDYLDGPLVRGDRDAMDVHLRDCGGCRDQLARLLELQDEARALPAGIRPPRDLWPGIEARIGGRKVIGIETTRTRRPVWRRPSWLAAAAGVALVALSSGATAYLLGGRGSAEAPVASAPAVEAPVERPTTALAAFRPTEVQYEGTVEALLLELESQRGQLAPETVAVIEENLRIIDRAIAESRAALEADPRNAELPLMLSDIYRTKVELLRYAVQLPART